MPEPVIHLYSTVHDVIATTTRKFVRGDISGYAATGRHFNISKANVYFEVHQQICLSPTVKFSKPTHTRRSSDRKDESNCEFRNEY